MPVVMPNVAKTSHALAGAADHGEVLELDTLLKRCLDDRALAVVLVEKFMSRLVSTVQDIEASLKARDWPQATAKAHSLKGEAGSLAATALHAQAALLEDCLRKSSFEKAAATFPKLKLAAEECLGARDSILRRLGQPASAAPDR